jgi:hypothetical protein
VLRVWNEAVVAYFKVQSQQLCGWIEKKPFQIFNQYGWSRAETRTSRIRKRNYNHYTETQWYLFGLSAELVGFISNMSQPPFIKISLASFHSKAETMNYEWWGADRSVRRWIVSDEEQTEAWDDKLWVMRSRQKRETMNYEWWGAHRNVRRWIMSDEEHTEAWDDELWVMRSRQKRETINYEWCGADRNGQGSLRRAKGHHKNNTAGT